MTDQEINIAIAEFCWKGCPCDSDNECYSDCYAVWSRDVPNYCTDLNAMHEAEKEFEKDKAHGWHYWRELAELTEGTASNWQSWQRLAHATARQRAEALLRTIGKWNE